MNWGMPGLRAGRMLVPARLDSRSDCNIRGAGWYAGARKSAQNTPAIIVRPVAVPPGQIYEPAISPDGKMVAFAATPEDETTSHIYLKLLGGGEPLRLTRDRTPDHGPVWSPDGRTIAFSRFTDADGDTKSIFTIPALGGPERLIASGAVLDWSPDGTALLVLTRAPGRASGYLSIAPEDGSARRLATALPDATPRAAHFSPMERWFTLWRARQAPVSLCSRSPAGGGTPRPVPITGMQGIGSGPFLRGVGIFPGFGFLRSGDIVFFARSGRSRIPRLYRVPASGGKAAALPFGTNGTFVATSRSSPAMMYVENVVNFNLWRVAAWPGGDREPRQWIGSERASQTPVVSPAGERIAYSSDRAGIWQIWSSDAEGRAGFRSRHLPRTPPTRSARHRGRRMGAGSLTTSTSADIPISGWLRRCGIARQLTNDNTGNIVPARSPDGLWVYFTRRSSGGVQTVWRVPAEGGPKQQITRTGGYSVKIAPDGQHIYYLKNSREGGLWRAPAEGGAEEPLLTECRTRNFWVLPEGIYMLDTGGNELAAMRRGRALFYRFATRKMEDLGFQTEKPVSPYGIGMSPDGKWLYYAQLDHNTSSLMNVENFQ